MTQIPIPSPRRLRNAAILCFVLGLAALTPIFVTGCATSPAVHNVETRTLLVVGTSVDTAMKVAAQSLKDGLITRTQWDAVAAVYTRYVAVFKVARDAVKDSNAPAPADVIAVSTELIALINSYRP